jgi:hypothetical protein
MQAIDNRARLIGCAIHRWCEVTPRSQKYRDEAALHSRRLIRVVVSRDGTVASSRFLFAVPFDQSSVYGVAGAAINASMKSSIADTEVRVAVALSAFWVSALPRMPSW